MRRRVHALQTVAFGGFWALLLLWGLGGGNNGGPSILAYGAFTWLGVIMAWLNITTRCAGCGRRIYSGRELMWPTPTRCNNCKQLLD
jgi:hypothetical protein